MPPGPALGTSTLRSSAFITLKPNYMKPLFYAALLILLAACNNAERSTDKNKIAGVYQMTSQRIKNDKTDTTFKELKQLKIFSDDFMMYTNFNPRDSASSFGIGTYEFGRDTIKENVFYSASDTTKDVDGGIYKLVIDKTSKGFKQTIENIISGDQSYTLYEEYEAVDKPASSALDGAWRAIRSYSIKDHDTTVTDIPRFKIYYNGYIMWGHTYSDSLNKNHTGIGYGTFQLNGNKLKEMMTTSTYHDIRGHDFDIDVEMNGTDEFKQTITNADGTKSVEVYRRMKK